MVKRAVITGIGVVSPNGIGKEEFCRAILAGKSGVKKITRFDVSDLPVQIAGEITDFDELSWIEARERKHVSRAVPLAVAASTEALRDAGIDWASMSLEQKRDVGVMLGSGGGAQEFSEEQYRHYFQGTVKQASLFSIPSGTMGRFSAEVGWRLGFGGLGQGLITAFISSTMRWVTLCVRFSSGLCLRCWLVASIHHSRQAL